MTFAYTVEQPTYFGNQRIVFGTFTNTLGSTGGDITTRLSGVDFFKIYYTGSAVVADTPVVNETFPLESDTVTIVTTANTSGVWFALGH